MAQIQHTQNEYGVRPEASEFPMMCVLSFVYVCNAHCPNCPYTNSNIRQEYSDRPLMHADTFKIIADQCGPHQAWIRLSGGGEPMLHPQAVELIEYAKSKGARIGLITNGSRFTEDSIQRLLACGTDMIEFSVDAADPDTYGLVRPGLDWERLVSTVESVVKLRQQMGSPTKIIASGINQEGVDIDQVEAFWSGIVDEFQKRKYLTWGINDDHSGNAEPYLRPDEQIPCPFIFERLNIDSRGKVMVCGFDIRAVTDMGNVHEHSIAEIWKGEGFNYYRRLHLERRGTEIPLCAQCPDWKYRSWKHNYWKIVQTAEKSRQAKLGHKGDRTP
jgi:radical SAM protein with 4Fe4S-binding SPASM domain